MKVTVDIPAPLYRKLKARAAMEGRSVREVTSELYERWLTVEPATPADREARGDAWVARWEALGRRVAEHAVDTRTAVEIVLGDRR